MDRIGSPFALSLFLGLTIAADARAEPSQIDLDIVALVEAIQNPAAFTTSPDEVVSLWSPLVGVDILPGRSSGDDCTIYLWPTGQRKTGVVQRVTGKLRPDSGCRGDELSSETTIVLETLAASDAQRLRDELDSRIGAPEPGCANSETTFWRPSPGRSIRWRQSGANSPTLELKATDPEDVNCAHSSAPPRAKLTPEKAEKLVSDLSFPKNELGSETRMSALLERYGTLKVVSRDECQVLLAVEPAEPWIGALRATIVNAECRTAELDSYMTFVTDDRDMFASDALYAAINVRHGSHKKICGRDVPIDWSLTDSSRFRLARVFSVSFLMRSSQAAVGSCDL